ncbi:MAG: hypothetical protein KAY32_13410 [Candidatus Eisenbacteria sp.]|nr:hypothetical protein [Candidatus Eisenbacteria bacterium]
MRCPAILAAALLGSAGAAGSSAAGAVPVYPLEEIRAGLQATALTVLAGEEPDSFRVEVIGVLPRGEAGSHLILVRALDERIARTGIAAGMSGSPLYADGRILGALAFSFVAATEPLGAATPIGEMLAVLEAAGLGEAAARDAPRLAALAAVEEPPAFPAWRRDWLSEVTAGDWPALCQPTVGGLPAGLQPIALPLFLGGELGSGAGGDVTLWEGIGLTPMPLAGMTGGGIGGAADEGARGGGGHRRLAPGDAFGISLISGDMVAAAIGTVTWIDGERLLGLGHPFLQIAPAEFPIRRARIHTIIPTRAVSFKVGTLLEEVGCLSRDGRPGVAGELGVRARRIPLHLTIVPRPGSEPRHYSFEVARHAILSPALLTVALRSAVTGETHALGGASMRTRIEVALDDGRRIARDDFFQTLGPGQTAAHVLAPVAYLAGTSLAPFSVAEVSVEIESVPELRALRIEQIRVPRPLVRPGDALVIEILLRHHLGSHETRQLRLEVPERLRGGRVRVMVGSAEAFYDWDRERAPQKYVPRDLDDLLEQIEQYPSDETLIVRLYGPSRGVVLQGKEIASLPLSKWRALQGATSSGKTAPVSGLILDEQRLPMGAVVLGGQVIELDVEL